jgi:hypothetical protein
MYNGIILKDKTTSKIKIMWIVLGMIWMNAVVDKIKVYIDQYTYVFDNLIFMKMIKSKKIVEYHWWATADEGEDFCRRRL